MEIHDPQETLLRNKLPVYNHYIFLDKEILVHVCKHVLFFYFFGPKKKVTYEDVIVLIIVDLDFGVSRQLLVIRIKIFLHLFVYVRADEGNVPRVVSLLELYCICDQWLVTDW